MKKNCLLSSITDACNYRELCQHLHSMSTNFNVVDPLMLDQAQSNEKRRHATESVSGVT